MTNPRIQEPAPAGAGDLEALGALCLPFLRGLAHELGNLLAGIQGNVHLLKVGQSEPLARESLGEIDECCRRTQDLLCLLRRCARPESGPVRFRPEQILDELKSLVEPLARRQGLRVMVSGGRRFPEREGFPWRLRAALLGLLEPLLEGPAVAGASLALGLVAEGSDPCFEMAFTSRLAPSLLQASDRREPGRRGACLRVLESLGCVVALEKHEDSTLVKVGLGRSRAC